MFDARLTKGNKKKLDKMNKKLEKMEDLSERVTEDRQLFQAGNLLMTYG